MVLVVDGGGVGVNFCYVIGEIVNCYCIVNVNWFFEQDNQIRDKVGENFL